MAPLLFKEMKGVDISCNSPVSTAICTKIARLTIAQPSSGGAALGRRIPHPKDPWRPRTIMSQVTTRPKSYTTTTTKRTSERNLAKQPAVADHHLISSSPGSSSRYLLNHDAFFDAPHDIETTTTTTVSAPVAPLQTVQLQAIVKDDQQAAAQVLKASDCSVIAKQEQVVVLRVGLHCKGCERKVRKHISKIEGVVSFEIDFALKKVTVIGELSPSEVLDRISKFKYAQLWPSIPSSTSSS